MSLINQSECRKAILAYAERRRPGRFTRVSTDVFEHLDTFLRVEIQNVVHQHPSIGKTLQMTTHRRNPKDKTARWSEEEPKELQA
jgi:hypothetical protein